MEKNSNFENHRGEILLYQTEDGSTRIDVKLGNETVWLTQKQMAELFDKDQSVIARHIRNAIKEGEIDETSNMHFLHNTFSKYRPTRVYNLDVIISVGYRVHSQRGVHFRKWASSDVKSLLAFYTGIFTKSGLERLTGINQKQLWHYANGISTPRRKQVQKIESALHRLGSELMAIHL